MNLHDYSYNVNNSYLINAFSTRHSSKSLTQKPYEVATIYHPHLTNIETEASGRLSMATGGSKQ